MERRIRHNHTPDVRSPRRNTTALREQQNLLIRNAREGYLSTVAKIIEKQTRETMCKLQRDLPRLSLPRYSSKVTDDQKIHMTMLGKLMGEFEFSPLDLIDVSKKLVEQPKKIATFYGELKDIQTQDEFAEKFYQVFPPRPKSPDRQRKTVERLQAERIDAAKKGYFIAEIQAGGQEAVMESKKKFDDLEAQDEQIQLGRTSLPLQLFTPSQIEQMTKIGKAMGIVGISEEDFITYSTILAHQPEKIEQLCSLLPEILDAEQLRRIIQELPSH